MGYLYKTVQGNNPVEDVKLLFNTIGSLIKGNAIAKPDKVIDNPVESLKRLWLAYSPGLGAFGELGLSHRHTFYGASPLVTNEQGEPALSRRPDTPHHHHMYVLGRLAYFVHCGHL